MLLYQPCDKLTHYQPRISNIARAQTIFHPSTTSEILSFQSNLLLTLLSSYRLIKCRTCELRFLSSSKDQPQQRFYASLDNFIFIFCASCQNAIGSIPWSRSSISIINSRNNFIHPLLKIKIISCLNSLSTIALSHFKNASSKSTFALPKIDSPPALSLLQFT